MKTSRSSALSNVLPLLLLTFLRRSSQYSNMYTGNEDGLKIAREHARMPALETKIDGLERQRKTDIEALKRDIEALKRQLTTDSEALKRQLSELHNAFNRQAQQTDLRLSLCCPDIRCRFLSTFRRDFMGDNSRENEKVIDQGNITAHHGFFMADATLYDSEGFTNQDGQHVPPRTDQDTFKRLYGVLPSLAKKISKRHILILQIFISFAQRLTLPVSRLHADSSGARETCHGLRFA